MDYADVDILVDGALEAQHVAHSDAEVETIISGALAGYLDDGLLTEVYVLWHGHDMHDGECVCAQYVTDHSPVWTSAHYREPRG